jgi:hypothetical protein
VRDVQRSVLLPKQVEQQEVRWETTGLQPQPVPDVSGEIPITAENTYAFRVVGQRYEAVLASVERQRAAARVRLADIHVCWQGSDTFTGFVAYDIEPAGMTELKLHMPHVDSQLIQARVAGIVAPAQRIDTTTWSLTTGSAQLPHRIEVLYQDRCQRFANGRVRLAAPRLQAADGNIVVDQTIWTVAGPPIPTGEWGSTNGHSDIERLSSELDRFASMYELMANVTSEEPSEVLSHWYRRWGRRLAACRRKIMLLVSEQRRPDDALHRQIENIDAQMSSLASHLVRQGVFPSPDDVFPAENVSRDLWWWSTRQTSTIGRKSQADWHGWLEVDDPRQSRGTIGMRTLAAMLLVGAAVGIVYGYRSTEGHWYASLWPRVFLFTAGLLYWLFLTPSVLGLSAILALLLWELLAGRRSQQPQASEVSG